MALNKCCLGKAGSPGRFGWPSHMPPGLHQSRCHLQLHLEKTNIEVMSPRGLRGFMQEARPCQEGSRCGPRMQFFFACKRRLVARGTAAKKLGAPQSGSAGGVV